MKQHLLFGAAALLLAASCGREEGPVDAGHDRVTRTFTADAVATRTALGDDWSVSWCEGDEISIVWFGGSAQAEAVLSEGKASFTTTVDEVDGYYAVYPSGTGATVGADGTLTLRLPSSQSGKFEDCAVIVSHTTAESLDFGRFKSAVALIRFSIADPSITRVSFSDPAGARICGSISTGPDCSSFTPDGSGGAIEASLDGSGTYYLSVLPGIDLGGLSFQLGTDSEWKGSAVSRTPVSLSAGEVLCVNTAVDGHLEVEGSFYITVDGAGGKDGSSWENAGDTAFLLSLLSDPDAGSRLDGKDIHVAAGTYDLGAGGALSLSYNTTSAVSVHVAGVPGGTVFTTSKSGSEGCILTVASDLVNLSLDGITFTGASHDGTGGALCLTKGQHSIKDCVFSGNATTSTAADRCGGAIYIGGTAAADIEGCTFEGNRAAVTGGGAVAVYSTEPSALLGCTFTGNTVHTGSAYTGNGGAILQKKAENILYVVNCTFGGNSCNVNGPDLFSSAGSAIMLYNDTFSHPAYPLGNSPNRGLVRLNVPAFVANCTFIMDVDDSATGAGCNNGVLALAHNGTNNVFLNNLMLSNAGWSIGAGAAYTSETTKAATSYGHNVYGEAPKIVITDNGGNSDLTGIRTADVVTETALSADGVLLWEGPQAKLPGFQPANAGDMSAAIAAYPVGGSEFLAWLTEKDLLGKDALGTVRGTDAWWPGAYQKAE